MQRPLFDEPQDEQPFEALTRRQRARWYAEGVRGSDGLTQRERDLLRRVREAGLEVKEMFLLNRRTGERYWHRRAVGQKDKVRW